MTSLACLSQARSLTQSDVGRRRREAAQISLRELADAIGVTPSTLSRWENGTSRPRACAALRWADALRSLIDPPPPPAQARATCRDNDHPNTPHMETPHV